jgi:hypothetical protein
LPAGSAEHRIEYMRGKFAATLAATIAAAVLIAPVLAGHVQRSGSAIITARGGSGIIAANF